MVPPPWGAPPPPPVWSPQQQWAPAPAQVPQGAERPAPPPHPGPWQPPAPPWEPPAPGAPSVLTTKQSERPHPLTPIARSWIVLAAMVFFIAREWIENGGLPTERWWVLILIGLGIVVVQGIAGIFVWRTTQFVLDDDELVIERKFITHSSDRISFAKIQSVDVLQPLLARILGLAKVHIDVGAGPGKSLEFLSRQRAVEMRDYLIRRMHGEQADVAGDAPAASASVLGDLAPTDEVLVRTSAGHLALGALTSNTLIVTALFGAFYWWLSGVIEFEGARVLLFGVIPGLFAVLYNGVIRQWNYALIRSGGGLKITRGMFDLVSQSLPRDRIQGLIISQSLLGRLVGLYEIRVTVLGYGVQDDAKEVSSVVLPSSPWDHVVTALGAIWPGLDMNALQWQKLPPRARWLNLVTYSSRSWAMAPLVAATRGGVVAHHIQLVPHARVQSLRLEQGPLMRWLRLMSIALHTTTGPVAWESGTLDADLARRVALDQIELARRARASDLALRGLLAGEPHPEGLTPTPPQPAWEAPPPAGGLPD